MQGGALYPCRLLLLPSASPSFAFSVSGCLIGWRFAGWGFTSSLCSLSSYIIFCWFILYWAALSRAGRGFLPPTSFFFFRIVSLNVLLTGVAYFGTFYFFHLSLFSDHSLDRSFKGRLCQGWSTTHATYFYLVHHLPRVFCQLMYDWTVMDLVFHYFFPVCLSPTLSLSPFLL